MRNVQAIRLHNRRFCHKKRKSGFGGVIETPPRKCALLVTHAELTRSIHVVDNAHMFERKNQPMASPHVFALRLAAYAGVVMAPAVHRLLHHFHYMDSQKDE